MAKRDCWGIEVGSNAIKAIRLVGDAKTEPVVAEYEVLPFKTVLSAPDVNADEEIQVALDQFLARHDVSESEVVVSVPGHMAFARFAKLPPVDPKKIPDIVRFEAVQQIPFPIDQVEWDYQVFQQEDSPDVEVGIFAITKDRVMQHISGLRAVRLQPDALTLSPLAVYNAMAYDMDLGANAPGTVFMDIGTNSTDVIIVEAGRIWLRTVPIGGNNFTEALVRAFNLSFAKAEKLKREAATSKHAKHIFQAMRPVFLDLVQEMQRSIGYYQSLNRDAKLERLVGLGSTFRLPGLAKFLKQQLQIDVTRLDNFKRISVEGRQAADFAQHALNLATAYGLALQGLERERVHANLLPTYLVKARMWKSKQPWMIAAAAMIVIASGLAFARYMLDQRAVQATQDDVGQRVQLIVTRAQGLRQGIDAVRGDDRRNKIENLRRMLDYRDVWPKLMLDLNLAFEALEPQIELLQADYERIRQIPRSERRIIHIDSITAEYNFVWDAPEAATDGEGRVATSLTLEEIWDKRLNRGPGAGPGGPVGPGFDPYRRGFAAGDLEELTEDEQRATQRTAQKPPTFFITITGTTPHRDAARRLGHYFLKWLQDQSKRANERQNRPYELIVGPESLASLDKFPDDPLADRERAQQTRGTDDMTASRAAVRQGRFGGTTAMPDFGVATQQETVDLGPLIPQRPLKEEPRANDWSFRLEFTVQLKKPEEVRHHDNGSTPVVEPAARPPAAEAPEADRDQEVQS